MFEGLCHGTKYKKEPEPLVPEREKKKRKRLPAEIGGRALSPRTNDRRRCG